jgi:myo-inositol-1(or 4)-monophosphatase
VVVPGSAPSARAPSSVPSPSELGACQTLAESVVLTTGRALGERREGWADSELEVGHDVKLVGDRGAEAVAVDLLRAGSDFAVYSEEAGLVGELGDVNWVLDPLDGSANYQRGIPLCCVSLALVVNGRPVLGVIYDFNRDELFSGRVGSGATVNGKSMRVSGVTRPAEAILTTGFPVAMDLEGPEIAEYIRDVRQYRKVRSLGTAALMMAYVASGRFDIYRERDVRFWDVAAGMALVEAAGGVLEQSLSDGDLGRKLNLVAYNGALEL